MHRPEWPLISVERVCLIYVLHVLVYFGKIDKVALRTIECGLDTIDNKACSEMTYEWKEIERWSYSNLYFSI